MHTAPSMTHAAAAALVWLLAACATDTPTDEPAIGPQVTADSQPSVPEAPAIDSFLPQPCSGGAPVSDPVRDPEREQREGAALAASSGRAQRTEATLVITATSGRRLVFVDCAQQEESWRQHRYEGLDAAGRGHVVSVSLYEGGMYVWVHAETGAHVTLASPPTFAPDGSHFAVANVDLEAEYTENEFSLWQVTDTAAVAVYRESGESTFGATDPIWLSPTECRYQRVFRASTPGQYLHQPVTAVLRDGRWQLDPLPPDPENGQ